MFRTSMGRAVALAVATTLLFSACSDDTAELEGTVVEDGLGCSILEVDRQDTAPEVAATEPVDELVTDDLETPGEEACPAESQSFLTLDLVGAKASDGTVFVNTYGADRPFITRLGRGELIAGLEVGLAELRVGGRRQLTIPAAEAYGAEGNPAQGIGPDETLVFVVDLVAVVQPPAFCAEPRPLPAGREGKPTAVTMPVTPWTELTTTDLTVGTGATAERDTYVVVEYLGVGCFSGAQFDSSWDRGEPIKVALDDAPPSADYMSVIPGWTDGIEGMQVGGVRQLDIPADLAYGDQGQGGDIAPGEPLVFIVQLLEVVEPPAGETTTTVAETTTTEG
jgi:peptidylprolyl isomerase